MKKLVQAPVLAFLVLSLLPATAVGADEKGKLPDLYIDGLADSVRVRRDQNNVPHIFALNDRDAAFVQGWVHAEDRFFQMDFQRRTFSGTLAELVGADALPSDVQLRTLGLRRACDAALPLIQEGTRLWLEGYADGVNAWLAHNSLPPEYGALALTTVPAWTPVDSLVIGKAIAFGLSFDLDDLDNTEAVLTMQAAGQVLGFDGTALFSEDLYRSAPFDPTVSIPGFLAAAGVRDVEKKALELPKALPSYLDRDALALVRSVRERLDDVPALASARDRRDAETGSNWWIASGDITDSGEPILANDPHLSLDTPSIFYEAQIRVSGKTGSRPMNVAGVTFAGVPGMVLGCNPRICWGATTNPMDVTDVYLEEVVIDPALGGPVATLFEGQPEPLVPIFQSFQFNPLNAGTPDTLVDAHLGPEAGGVTLLVPRRNGGPIVAVMPDGDDPTRGTAISVQYAGFGPTFELDAFQVWHRAKDVGEFRDSLQYFDVGSQNWSVADVDGNIAYFTSAEMPIREDLQTLHAPDGGIPPWLLRDGTHTFAHEWMAVENPQPGQVLPFEILPFDEMPQVVNPASGYVLNCNNDPVGTTVDNNPLNQLRPGGGLYYLNPGYASGFREGRIQRLFDAAGGEVSRDEIQAFQANNQLLDAEVLTPYILDAFANGTVSADPTLAALAADPGVAEAVGRLTGWDFSTPTGIPEGFDPGDDPHDLPEPGDEEIAASVAATIYSTWRGRLLAHTIDATVDGLSAVLVGVDPALDLRPHRPGSALAMSALRNLLDHFDAMQGTGASGVQFFTVPGVDDSAVARDILILQSVRDALDLLASPEFAAAFGESTDQEDYRWGRLHRIVFDHPLGGPFNIPNGGGLADLDEGLPGVAKGGGFGALDASSHSARSSSVNSFMFGSGPARRFVGVMTSDGPLAEEVTPGGASGVPGSPFQADQLLDWLTNHTHPLIYRPDGVIDVSSSGQTFYPGLMP